MLALNAVSKDYHRGKSAVMGVRRINFAVPKGDFVAVVGPSGSGKSTLLLLMGGMLTPTDGEVVLQGNSLYHSSIRERAKLRSRTIGFVFQTFNLLPYLSALENVQVPMMLACMPPVQQRERATALLTRMGLQDRLEHMPSELSIGQQQRVALARTLANNPELVLADEPTGNLDPETGQSVLKFLKELNEEGKTIVMVTHDPRAAEKAKRIVTLRAGELC